MSEIFRAIVRVSAEEGGVNGVRCICERLHRLLRSRLLAAGLNAPGLSVGKGCVFRGVRRMQFGRNVTIGDRAWVHAITRFRGQTFSPLIVLGDNVSMSNNVHIACVGTVEIGDGVLIGSNVLVSDHNHGEYAGVCPSSPDIPPAQRPLSSAGDVVIESNVWIADNVVVNGSVRIGRGSVVGANVVVKHDVPPYSIVVGAATRVVRTFKGGRWL